MFLIRSHRCHSCHSFLKLSLKKVLMPQNQIAITGDKGQAATLLGLPTFIFNDKKLNIDLISDAVPLSTGMVVRRGYKSRHSVRRGYRLAPDPLHW